MAWSIAFFSASLSSAYCLSRRPLNSTATLYPSVYWRTIEDVPGRLPKNVQSPRCPGPRGSPLIQ